VTLPLLDWRPVLKSAPDMATEMQRRKNTRERLIERLLQGPANTDELSAIARKYTSRTTEIRRWAQAQGGDLVATHLRGGLWLYTLTLRGEP
jgi:hypothetical protein